MVEPDRQQAAQLVVLTWVKWKHKEVLQRDVAKCKKEKKKTDSHTERIKDDYKPQICSSRNSLSHCMFLLTSSFKLLYFLRTRGTHRHKEVIMCPFLNCQLQLRRF